MTEVKPCPFCGSNEFEIRERVMEGKKGYPVTLLHWCYHDRATQTNLSSVWATHVKRRSPRGTNACNKLGNP